MSERIYLYDTTLRDGAQTQGVDFSVGDKITIARQLDALGIDYVEGGWPGANPTADAFFAEPPALERAKFCAFAMTRRSGRSAANDPGLAPVFRSRVDVITLVGKTWTWHVTGALGAELDENLAMIQDSLEASRAHASEVMFDAEHFFDGYRADPAYALACLKAADAGGADWLVLCDTNGGTLPAEIERVVAEVRAELPDARLGIHTHNDSETAVAGALAGIRAGARQVQGTLNGLGERCGNANLVSLIPALVLKEGFVTGIDEQGLKQLTYLSRQFDELLNRSPWPSAPYVGANAFAHKGGLHASAVARNPLFYEHIDPEAVGNHRDIVVSDQAGRSNLMARLREIGCDPAKVEVGDLLRTLKEKESQGYAFEGAAASFEILTRRTFEHLPTPFMPIMFNVQTERRINARNETVTVSRAIVEVEVDGQKLEEYASGAGPVGALDHALRKTLLPSYPSLADLELSDYRVRILNPEADTDAVTRVIMDSHDRASGRTWSTVGVSANIIEASFLALTDSITYKLYLDKKNRQAA
ncbi:MAG: citramalate synthase [Geminicoccaceae bacterium]